MHHQRLLRRRPEGLAEPRALLRFEGRRHHAHAIAVDRACAASHPGQCLCPGHIETPFWTGIAAGFSKITGKTPEEVVGGFAATIPWGRFGTPEDVAMTVSWLACPEAEYVNGQTIGINGAELPT